MTLKISVGQAVFDLLLKTCKIGFDQKKKVGDFFDLKKNQK